MKSIYKNKSKDGNKCTINKKDVKKIKIKIGWINMIRLWKSMSVRLRVLWRRVRGL